MVRVLTSLSRVLVTVVMTPVCESMANRSNPVKREYLILTWSVPSWSLSVAFNFPTTVPVVSSTITEFIITAEGQTPQDFWCVCSCSSPALLCSSTVHCSEPVNVGALSFTSSTIMVTGKGSSVCWWVDSSKTLTVNCKGKVHFTKRTQKYKEM